ncbi:hypothetical protein DFS33DRAFT_1276921 [Desarmillaria ectypa]|nr:hypothetical protein DFS33DRAFT_1276921 [Desarmillaria ectypa]
MLAAFSFVRMILIICLTIFRFTLERAVCQAQQSPTFNDNRTNYFIQRRRQRTIEQFYSLICAHPHIATLVRAIEVSPLLDTQPLARTLEKLTGLENISIDLFPLLCGLLSPFGGSGHLKRPTLSGVSCGGISDSQIRAENTGGLQLQLESLAISLYEHSYFPLLKLLQSSVNLSRLHQLSVFLTGPGHPAERVGITEEILRQLNSSSLKHLVLNVRLGEPLSYLIDVSNEAEIHIKLWWMRLDQHTKPGEWLRWMSTIFWELVQWHRLEEASDFRVYIDEWAALDAVLGRIQSLRKVYARLDNYDAARARWRYSREYPSSLRDDAKGVLPTLAKKKKFFVELTGLVQDRKTFHDIKFADRVFFKFPYYITDKE